jgi:hypothetical protein
MLSIDRRGAGRSRQPQVCRKTARSCAFPEPGMIAKLLLQNLLYVAGMGALLFLFAGTLHWPAAWTFLGTIAVSASPAACGSREEILPCWPSACGR